MTFQERADRGIILFDGAMGTMLIAENLPENDYDGKNGCSEILNITRPDVIRSIHEKYLEAGSDVIETNSFGSNEIVLSEYGIADRAREISRIAASLARSAADKYSSTDKPRFAAGSAGPGTKLVSLGHTDWDTMHHSYSEQFHGLLDGGVDLFLIETCQDVLQIKCALCAAFDVMEETGKKIPVIVTVTVETTGSLLLGTEIPAVIAALEPYDIFALGMNCATGPDAMLPFVKQISELWHGRILVQPNAGLPQNVNGKLVYTLTADEYVRVMSQFIEQMGVTLCGGCCGTDPGFIRALAAAVPGLKPGRAASEYTESVSSLFEARAMTQSPPPFFIGERTNTNGSKLFREALLRDDYEALAGIASAEESTGVHALDICVAYAGRDEVGDMTRFVSDIARRIKIPLVIDSTELPVLEAALKLYGGRAVINSVNLEAGGERARKICALAKRYGAALIALVIDERGMAKQVPDKIEVAKRIYDIAVHQCGLRSGDLIFDMLTFTLGSGDETLRDSAKDTIEGIRLVKSALPGVRTVLGLSNVSFGLAPYSRKILNSVFLNECVDAGLDMAIVNLRQIMPVSEISPDEFSYAENLLLNKKPEDQSDPLFSFISFFESKAGIVQEKETAAESMLPQEKLNRCIIKGSKVGLPELLDALRTTLTAEDIINTILIPAMKQVGELFGSGKMQLPFVLQSAEVMKASVDLLKPFMKKIEGEQQLSIVLATVRGDVHDIGKNLVDIILSNNGYKVYNLGIKVEADEMIRKAQEVNASAIGMSGLLVKSTSVMKENIEEIVRRKLDIPVLLGGAALTPDYVYDVCSPLLSSGVVYCSDAFEGLRAMNFVKDKTLISHIESEKEKVRRRHLAKNISPAAAETADIRRDVNVPRPPFLGIRQTSVDIDTVFSYLTEEVLFRGRWGYRRGTLSKEEYADLIEKTVRPEFETLKQHLRASGLLKPMVSYGYFECNSSGNQVILYKPETKNELARFTFPRQEKAPRLCVADYFYPADSGITDIIALQVATVGSDVQKECEMLYRENHYKEYLILHGLSVECAEALAEHRHKVIRGELGIADEDGTTIQDFVVQKYRGSRYSFGYPACPDLSQNRILCSLADSGSIGVTLTDGDQMIPEQTTSAFIVHHPQAKYFSM